MEPKRFVGNWWLPGGADRPVGGVLEVDSASSRLRLELTDRLLEQGPSADRTPMTYGAANGREITLLESAPANGGHTTMAQVVTTTQVVQPRVALVGIRLNDPREEVFDGLKTSMTLLTAWASRSGLDYSWIATPDTDDRSRLTVRWTDPLETRLDEPPETAIKVSTRPNRWTAAVTSCSAVAGSAMSPAIVSTPGSCEVLMVREFATTA
jgi:hypothetical protein